MRKNIYFLDFENLQSSEEELKKYIDDSCEIFLFHGVNQNNFPAYWVSVGIQLGHRLHRVQLKESASNALDFFIAYYIGLLSQEADILHFHIISNDKGYDPLIDHLREKGRVINRISRPHNQSLHIVSSNSPITAIDPELVNIAIRILSLNSRPSIKEKLINVINNTIYCNYKGQHSLPEIDVFLAHLQSEKLITIHEEKIDYLFPVHNPQFTEKSEIILTDQVLSPNMLKQLKMIFGKSNRPLKEKSLRSVIESSVITQKDNIMKLTSKEVLQHLQLSKVISITNEMVTYHSEITQPLLNQNYEKCQKILNKINERSRPATEEKYIASIKSWVKCTNSEAVEIFKLLKKNNKTMR